MTPDDKSKIKRFLLGAINTDRPLAEALAANGLAADELFRLARSKQVRRWIRRITRASASAMRELEVARGALSAAEQMSERIAGRFDPADGSFTESIRKLWVDAIKLARAREDREEALDRASDERESDNRQSRPRDISELVSPDVPQDEAAQILARMLARQREAR